MELLKLAHTWSEAHCPLLHLNHRSAPMIPQMYPGTTAPPLTPQVFSPLPAGDPNPPTPVYGAAAPRVPPSFGYVYTPEQLAKWHEMSNQALPPPPGQGFKRIPKTGNRE